MAKIYTSRVPKVVSEAGKSFKTTPNFKQRDKLRKDKSAELTLKLEELRVDDIDWRVKSRGWVTKAAYSLLFIQNGYMAYLVWYSLHLKTVPNGYFQFMVVLIGATLTESAYIIRLIVTWLFTEISYKDDSPKNQ